MSMTTESVQAVNFTGERLRELRGNKTLEEVARAIGISLQSLQQIETKKHKPSADTLARLCVYFNIPITDLCAMPENP